MVNKDVDLKEAGLYFLLVAALSVPFWVLGALPAEDFARLMPVNLPLSALMAVCPLTAAALLSRRGGAHSPSRLRTFDCRRIPRAWLGPVLLTMPVLTGLSYALMQLVGAPLPDAVFDLTAVPLLFLLFLAGGVCEEAGWQGYAHDRIEGAWTALRAAILIGTLWAAWHIIPYMQAGHGAAWIFWQCANTVALRVLIVWAYNNTGKSVFAASLFHAMINMSVFLFPNYGSHYDPAAAFVFTGSAAAAAVRVWGAPSLARIRFRPPQA